MTDNKHLWEYDHPYYCNEGNYLARPLEHPECWETHESWQSFIEDWGDSDPDMNLVFRWDWHAWHLECPEDYPDTEKHELQLFFMLQRKAFNKSVSVTVTEEDEPAVREWLRGRARTVAAIWEPLVSQVPSTYQRVLETASFFEDALQADPVTNSVAYSPQQLRNIARMMQGSGER